MTAYRNVNAIWRICECSGLLFFLYKMWTFSKSELFFYSACWRPHWRQERLRLMSCQLPVAPMHSVESAFTQRPKWLPGFAFPLPFTMWWPRKMNSTNTAATYFISPARENEMSSRDTYPSRELDMRQNLITWGRGRSGARRTLRENYQLSVCFFLQEKSWR